MTYEYKCTECGEVIQKEMSMIEDHPKVISCPKCGNEASRVWGNNLTKIPETFKATSDICGGDNAGNFNYLKNRMKHGVRPSGRSKIYY